MESAYLVLERLLPFGQGSPRPGFRRVRLSRVEKVQGGERDGSCTRAPVPPLRPSLLCRNGSLRGIAYAGPNRAPG